MADNGANPVKSLYMPLSNWLASLPARPVVLFLAAMLSLPSQFSLEPALGLDPAWGHSLQAAASGGRVFGRDFIFTYGPLGYLLTRAPVSKMNLLLYDLFVLGSLLSIYRKLLPAPVLPARVLLVLAVAMITKYELALKPGSEAILFIIAGYWLWRYCAGDSFLIPLAASLAASLVLFFSKVNYGLLLLGLIPCYSLGLLVWRRDWRRAVWLSAGFAVLVFIGSVCWRVELRGYLRASLELAGSYNEAMSLPLGSFPLVFVASALFVLAIMAASLASLRSTALKDWLMICPFVMLTAWLMFQNAFVRSGARTPMLTTGLPLLLAFWSLGFQGCKIVNVLLVLGVLGGVGQLERLGYAGHWFSWTPLRYAYGFSVAPWRQNTRQLGAALRAAYPDAAIPTNVLAAVGRSSVAVLPWDSSLAILNGLNDKEFPVIQSYAAFTPWLDTQNAQFLSSSNAPDFVLYVKGALDSIDDRPAAWDESITKRALMQNYSPYMEFRLGERLFMDGPPEPALVFVLKRSPRVREYEPISTNDVTLALDQKFEVPDSTNYEFLWLGAERTPLGKLSSMMSQSPALTVAFNYVDGTCKDYRAILPILKTGVLINYRLESAQEIRSWLSSETSNQPSVRSIQFKSTHPWAFQSPFHGKLITYRLVQQR